MRIGLNCREVLSGEAMASLLEHEGHFEVVVVDTSLGAFISSVRDLDVQVIVIDSIDPKNDELDLLMAGRSTSGFGVVILAEESTDYSGLGLDKVYVRSAGARGLFKAIREVGDSLDHSSGRTREGLSGKVIFSRRDLEVAFLVGKGLSNREISEVMGIEVQSINRLVRAIKNKLKCKKRVLVALSLAMAKVKTDET